MENSRERECDASINNNISPSPNITHMKYVIIYTLILAGVLLAGCTGTQAPPPTIPPTTVPVTTTVATPTPEPSFAIGDHYLQTQYKFNSPTDVYTEKFIVDSPSWAIKINVSPKSDNLDSCWFVLNVTQMNTGHVDTFGYGRMYSFENDQLITMYKEGPYEFDMQGNLVTVVVTAAKRLP